jgi:hypothetical protein
MKKKRAESWYNSFLVNRGQVSWQELIQEIVERFEVRNVVGVVDEFNHLRQRGSLEEYKSQLEELRAAMLMCNPYYDDNLFRQSFLGGKGIVNRDRCFVRL